jgi:hypothetical protein
MRAMTPAGHLTVHNLMAMSYAKDPRVDDYIDRLPDWQQAISQEVRKLVHAAAIVGRNRAGGWRKLSSTR